MISKKICRKIKKELSVIKAKQAFAFSKSRPYTETVHDEQLVCVATTIPSRINVLHNSIESILRQTIRPHKIVIYLGKNLFEGVVLPDNLINLCQFNVEFRYVEDVRVHTKYFYAFQEFNNSLVMTFDDDIIYRPNLIEELLKAHNEYPNCVVCSRAHKIMWNKSGELLSYNLWKWESVSVVPSYQLVATGVGGVLYKPRNFLDRLYDKKIFLEVSTNNDDLWLKWVELCSKIPVVTLKRNIWYFIIEDSQKEALNTLNVHRNQNDIYCSELVKYFKIGYSEITKLEQQIDYCNYKRCRK